MDNNIEDWGILVNTAKKAVAKKVVAKKAVAKKVDAKKGVAKKVVAKKTVAKKAAGKKTAGKKSAAKKGTAKKDPAKPARSKITKTKIPKRIEKPWPVPRIRTLMRWWGMSQVEFAVFSGVSYDSVTSWCRGRRRLVRRETSEHLERAEKIANSRKLPKVIESKWENPWLKLRTYCTDHYLLDPQDDKDLKSFNGTFPFLAVETQPEKFRRATQGEQLTVKMGGKKEPAKVSLHLGRQKLAFEGIPHQMGGAMVLELVAPDKDKRFLKGRAGCITYSQGMIRICLWAIGLLPLRVVGAVKA